MNKFSSKTFSVTLILTLLASMVAVVSPSYADNSAQTLPFSQNWSNTGLITTNDNWSGVAGIIGYRGDGLVSSTNVDPQTVLADGSATPVDVNANQVSPNTFSTGGVSEFEITDSVVALQGSGTADAPHIVIYLDTTGQSNINISYNVRDIDGSADNSAQQVALQYRVGNSGNYTNIPAGYIADATMGGAATLVTPINAALPAAVDNQSDVQIRIITTDAAGSDEWVGIDDISITVAGSPTNPSGVGSASPSTVAPGDPTLLTVNVTPGTSPASTGLTVSCDLSSIGGSATQSFLDDGLNGDATAGDNIFSFAATVDGGTSEGVKSLPCTIADAESRSGNASIALTVQEPVVIVINEIHADPDATGGDANGDGTIDSSHDEFVEIVNNEPTSLNISGWTLSDGVGVKHTFPANTVVPASCSIVVFAGGTPTGTFGHSLVQVASTGQLGLNNLGGDTVTLNNGTSNVASYTYGNEGNDNQSLTRDPDVTGADPLVKHSLATGSGGTLYSPGTKVDGSQFAGCPVEKRIHEIQGEAHTSPYVSQSVVNVPGIVTALASNGFYLQDPNPDANENTSEGIFVFTVSAPTVTVGDSLLVSGTVAEFRPGSNPNNLTITEITSPTIAIVSSGNPLPVPIVLGNGGRAIPTSVIENDASNVESGGVFDPTQDGIDFYESLEGMRVQVNNPVTTSRRATFGASEEIWVLADNGVNATSRTVRGGSLVTASDFNPERIQVDDLINGSVTLPVVDVGAQLDTIIGVVNYDFANFEVLVSSPPVVVTASPLTKEVTTLTGTADQLTVSTFNVENLDPGDGSAKFNALASAIVNNLNSPDILNLEEIQDNNGPTNDSVVAANVTIQTLIDAIVAAGGPTYEFRQIDPVDDTNGGEPGGNIRVGFLFNPARVSFVDRPGGTSTANTTVTNNAGTPTISFSPGLINPTNSAFNSSRKPLVGEFVFNGQTVFVIGNHFSSKGGDQPLFGPNQPPTLNSETVRNQQATIVSTFVQSILAIDPNANVIVAGDLNDFEFSNPITILENGGLNTLVETLPANERYTYNFEGNAQVLDHILVSDNLLANLDGFDIVHINSEFFDQVSDHDPALARMSVTPPTFTLQLLHYYGESGLLGVDTGPIMGAMIDKFDDQYNNTLVLGEGDSFIPGPWLIGGADPSLNSVPGIGSTALGRPDIAIMNAFGTDASALGNHEFDLGSPVLQGAIQNSGSWVGAQFPLITANLDFTADSALKPLADSSLGGNAANAFAGQEASAIKGKIAPYAVVTMPNGEKIGLVGATTYELLTKTSPNGTLPKDDGNPATDDLQEVAMYLQAAVDSLNAMGVDKIIMVDQLDTIERNKLLAPMVSGIDVMIAGGGHERMGDATDTPVGFNGHTADFLPAPDTYPIVTTGLDGKPVLIVTTDTEYTYLGRLVLDFDANGEIILPSLDPAINGAYASTEANLQAAYGTSQTANDIIASSVIGSKVKAITTAINNVITVKDGTIWGYTNVYIEGDRAFGRTQEVNLGDISADANIYAVEQVLGSGYITSLKNGGGLRASIGSIAENGSKIPPIANPLVGKPAGAISTLDIENALRFNNRLMVFETTPQGLKNILEYAAGLSPNPTVQAGGFMQIGGMRVSYDPNSPAGSKVKSIALTDLAGNFLVGVYQNGAFTPDAPATITMVSLNFTANGGDGYPIKANADNFRFLLDNGTLSAPVDESLNFTASAVVPANALGEQKAFQDYLQAFHDTPANAYDQADTPIELDQRIQILSIKPVDTVFPPDVTIDQAAGQVDPTGTSLINFTVVFTRSVTGFDGSDVDLSGTANPTTAVVTEAAPNDGTTFNVAVSGMTANGTVIASIPANVVDGENRASTSTDNTVTYNNTAPTIVVAAGGMCGTSNGTLNLLLTDAEGDPLNLTGSSSNTSAVPNANIVFGGSGLNRTVTITGVPPATIRTANITVTVSDGINTSAVTIRVVVGTAGNDLLVGSSGADLLLGFNGHNTFFALGGKDLLCGGHGNDTMFAGDGDDTLFSGSGNDILFGGNGSDTLDAGAGRDVVDGGPGDDILLGGDNNDVVIGGSGNDSINGGNGNDTCHGGSGTDSSSACEVRISIP